MSRRDADAILIEKDSDAPLRAELLTAEQMEERGRELSGEHRLRSARPSGNVLLRRLRRNEIFITQTCQQQAEAIREHHRITPAGEWLLDHLYVINEQIGKARTHLPQSYSSELPVLARGVSAGLPRVYDIALEAISHSDGRVDQESLGRFIRAYQTGAPLSLGELWAVPIMLRLALIENLARAATRVYQGLQQSRLAARWAQRMLDVVQRDPKSLILVVADMARDDPPMTQSFVAEMARRLQGPSALNLPLSWIEQRLGEAGLTIAQLVQSAHHERAIDQVTISNSITSLRLLDALDWHQFVESTSEVERLLSDDPAGVYPGMDFATRDAYRHVIERVAKQTRRDEIEVAKSTIALARAAAQIADPGSVEAEVATHVGYYLVGAGLAHLRHACAPGQRIAAATRWRDGGLPFGVYLGAIVVAGALFAAPFIVLLTQQAPGWWLGSAVALCIAVAASHPAVWLINRLAMVLSEPVSLPRLDMRAGIPANARALVVVPCLLGSAEEAQTLAENLELRYLANRDPQLAFALLSDYPDADQAERDTDAPAIDAAAAAIEALNRRYPAAAFLVLHRPRVWSDSEQCWMGRERKRGKLGDLNQLLRNGDRSGFSRIVGDPTALAGVRYVITLDTDTQLPRDAARLLVATMQHPLNRPRFAANGRDVVAGYTILQPRVGNLLPPAGTSRYAALFGGDAGVDPYTMAVSDVYQDLFGEGSFIGKGIYDVDAFERVLGGRFPDNRILSHDLLEGCYSRAGLTTDIALYEEYPQSYRVDAARRARWIRGDWQIAAWLFPSVPSAGRQRERNPLPLLSRWKIFDNLRRSVLAPALFALLLLGWLALPAASIWPWLVLAVPLLPIVADVVIGLLHTPVSGILRHLSSMLGDIRAPLARALFQLSCIPFETWQNGSAIVRTGWRVHVSQRHLMQWVASSEVERRARRAGRYAAAWNQMLAAPVLSVLAGGAVLLFRPDMIAYAAPWLLLWFLAPVFAGWLAGVPEREKQQLDATQVAFVRAAARRTWAFFERFVSAEDNWLPPDNFQEHPGGRIAHRTSSTNIGLGLLANLSAYDLGYVSLRGLVAATRRSFETLQKLERYRGHIYNWYTTDTLQPLQPMYVSTVDSGNFVAHLLVLRQGLFECLKAPVVGKQAFAGLADTFSVLRALGEGIATAVRWEPFADALADAHRLPDTLPVGATRSALRALFAAARLQHASLTSAPSPLREWSEKLLRHCSAMLAEVEDFLGNDGPAEAPMPSLSTLAQSTSAPPPSIALAQACIAEIEALGALCADFATVDFEFLYDPTRDQFAIGYNVSEGRRDNGYYDLLASEVRLGVYVAVAKAQVPTDGWFALGRVQTETEGGQVLLSWSGSMFEYLMPQLVMPTFADTLLDQSTRLAVARQIAYGREKGVPWGISESGFHLTDAAQNYHYRAFGVPGLGLQRGLSQDLVIAPYATALALTIVPADAVENLRDIAARGWWSQYGFYEAIDFTPARVTPGENHGVVREYMAHHQGMSLLAFAQAVLGTAMQRRFLADREMHAATLLLQERVPREVIEATGDPQTVDIRSEEDAPVAAVRRFTQADTPRPAVQLLSNGSYHVMLTQSGAGYSRWRDLAVTRWREDPTRDPWGTLFFIRDQSSGKIWSTASAALAAPCAGDTREVLFTEGAVELHLRMDQLDARMQIIVSPEDDVEVRRLRIGNRSRTPRTLEITSYAEVVLASAASDSLHPAFGNLFVQTEIVPSRDAILATRRPRAAHEAQPWLLHLAAMHGHDAHHTSFETDRMRFLGRGGDTRDALALRRVGALSNTAGAVLDPVVAIRHSLTLAAESGVVIDFVTGVSDSRAGALGLADKYRDRHLADRAFELAQTHNRMVLGQINISAAEAQIYARVASAILYVDPARRAGADVVASNRRSQPGLWAHGISGDWPIVLLHIEDADHLTLVRQLVAAHTYCRLKGLVFDLVILNEDRGGYRQSLHDAIHGAIAVSSEASVLDRPGGVFVRESDQISHEDRVLLQAIARIVLSDAAGTLSEQLQSQSKVGTDSTLPRLVPVRRSDASDARQIGVPQLESFNGFGGFARDGREYVIVSGEAQRTPLPWANVIANPHFGFVATESGCGYTFFTNAHEYRLTPWQSDMVSDGCGEIFYIRDDESGAFWSPTPLPVPGRGRYLTRHGFGYTQFEHVDSGITSDLRIYVDSEAPIKFFVLRLRNDSGRTRKVSVTGYVEWVLGDLAAKTTQHIVTELDASGALFARNAWNAEFADYVGFFDIDHPQRTLSGDRTEFLGRNGNPAAPAAMTRATLSGHVGALLDPCAAIQVPIELADGESRDLIFRLGAAHSAEEAAALVKRFRVSGTARASLEAINARWQRLLGTISVTTPDRQLNALTNGWLLYQTLSCRLWARSGFYQSGGAFGFRDQLQDAMALVHADPGILRAQIVLAASRQFREGDVQHWWHPPEGRGVRTQCSDDYLWLPLAVARYLQTTADAGVLDERSPYLEARQLNAGEESYYDLPLRSNETADVYQHCVRAIERALSHGLAGSAHGLPRMGTCDWNDGMNRVGAQGKGESVWLGFFLYHVLTQFRAVASLRGDDAFAVRCVNGADELKAAIEKNGWDGDWYRRAYFDDGTPLGSATNTQCRIDSIAQSWSVLSGAGDSERASRAMDALDKHLVDENARLIRLLDPPFDREHGDLQDAQADVEAPHGRRAHVDDDPGYIAGYLPGVRENGGQYTHAAVWAVMAFAQMGRVERAWELFNLINPLRHADDAEAIDVYKVEPYVVAADVYSNPAHYGRGGWTWYTGSAGWMYRLIVESLLGLTREGVRLRITPRLPRAWSGVEMVYRYGEASYAIRVLRDGSHPVGTVLLDGAVQADASIPLAMEAGEHKVIVCVEVSVG